MNPDCMEKSYNHSKPFNGVRRGTQIKTTKIPPLLQFEKPTTDRLSQIGLKHNF